VDAAVLARFDVGTGVRERLSQCDPDRHRRAGPVGVGAPDAVPLERRMGPHHRGGTRSDVVRRPHRAGRGGGTVSRAAPRRQRIGRDRTAGDRDRISMAIPVARRDRRAHARDDRGIDERSQRATRCISNTSGTCPDSSAGAERYLFAEAKFCHQLEIDTIVGTAMAAAA